MAEYPGLVSWDSQEQVGTLQGDYHEERFKSLLHCPLLSGLLRYLSRPNSVKGTSSVALPAPSPSLRQKPSKAFLCIKYSWDRLSSA